MMFTREILCLSGRTAQDPWISEGGIFHHTRMIALVQETERNRSAFSLPGG
jgi:hypothetical protein